MALFKILHGDKSRISTDITPFKEGNVYVTHDGSMYADMNIGTEESPNNQRIQIHGNTSIVIKETVEIAEDNTSTITIPFTCSDIESLMVYQDGILLTINENYTVTNNTITLIDYVCNTGDLFTFTYFTADLTVAASKDYVDNLFNSMVNSEEVQY